MKKVCIALGALAVMATAASAQEKLVISTWGGNWKEGVAIVGKEFTKRTGVEVEYITGGTLDRLAKAKVARDNPESDLVNTTGHVGYLYYSDGLMEKIDWSKVPNAAKLYPMAKRSDYTVSDYVYVYAPAFRTDQMPKDFKIDSWEVLWGPEVKGKLGLPDFDPSHIIIAATKLAGVKPEEWDKVKPKLLELKPSIKAFYQSDATSQNLMRTGETPVQVLLNINGYHLEKLGMPVKIEVPKEGAVVGVDVWGINKNSKHKEWAEQFLNIALEPEMLAKLCNFHKCSPMSPEAKLDPEVAKLPGIFTSQEQIEKEAIVLEDKTYATLLPQWKVWFTENMMH
ncbi:ABC transporter substrate-binding protein [Ancylobacter pratisalsi]|uniref:ABC transporter substrate-binding protein n=1 Tax=Ancylobacter pratisalsi TaxID=1745854 RepID=A0A6P1YPJ8_9HYPH|nr:ABC transporter substrate-binding protein [Ancylobacter pratisalsi]QIB34995.1 ABC transporter substrate-binding protein [Ancylobacter pratisalsi]